MDITKWRDAQLRQEIDVVKNTIDSYVRTKKTQPDLSKELDLGLSKKRKKLEELQAEAKRRNLQEPEYKSSYANWSVELWADCPHCKDPVALHDQFSDLDYPLEVAQQYSWNLGNAEDLEDIVFTCDNFGCKEEFVLCEVEY